MEEVKLNRRTTGSNMHLLKPCLLVKETKQLNVIHDPACLTLIFTPLASEDKFCPFHLNFILFLVHNIFIDFFSSGGPNASNLQATTMADG